MCNLKDLFTRLLSKCFHRNIKMGHFWINKNCCNSKKVFHIFNILGKYCSLLSNILTFEKKFSSGCVEKQFKFQQFLKNCRICSLFSRSCLQILCIGVLKWIIFGFFLEMMKNWIFCQLFPTHFLEKIMNYWCLY